MTYKKRQTAEAVCLKETNHLSLVWEVGNFWDKERGDQGTRGRKSQLWPAIKQQSEGWQDSIYLRYFRGLSQIWKMLQWCICLFGRLF